MKKSYILFTLIVLLIGLQSCQKEEIIPEDPIVEIDPPEEIDYPVVTGIVTANSSPVTDVIVNIYQNEVFIGEVKTDIDGTFNTVEYELSDEGEVTLVALKADYLVAYRRRNIESLVGTELEIKLNNTTGGPTSGPLDDPGSMDFVSLSGYVLDYSDLPAYATGVAVWEKIDSNGYDVVYFQFFSTDDDGYYELLVPKDCDFYFLMRDAFCEFYVTEEEVFVQGGNFWAEMHGPYSENVVLDNYINPYDADPSIEISGEIQNCDGTPTIGTAYVHFDDGDIDQHFVFETDPSGAYGYSKAECFNIPYEVTVYGYDSQLNKYSDTVTYVIDEATTNIVDLGLMTCNDGDPAFSNVSITVGSNTYHFNKTAVRLENGDLISDDLDLSSALFTIPGAQTGDNEIESFNMLNFLTGVTFVAVENTVTVNISSLTSNEAIATFEGEFFDDSGAQVTATGTMELGF